MRRILRAVVDGVVDSKVDEVRHSHDLGEPYNCLVTRPSLTNGTYADEDEYDHKARIVIRDTERKPLALNSTWLIFL